MSVSFLRLQTHDGLGAYRGSAYYTVIQFYSGWLTEHPMPDHDPLLVAQDYQNFSIMYGEAMRFGFSDQTQLKKWFHDPDSYEPLNAAGLKVYMYEVPNNLILIGETQAVAIIDPFKFIGCYTLLEV